MTHAKNIHTCMEDHIEMISCSCLNVSTSCFYIVMMFLQQHPNDSCMFMILSAKQSNATCMFHGLNEACFNFYFQYQKVLFLVK